MEGKNKTAKQIINEIVEQGIFDAIGDGVSIQDTNFRILYQNKVSKESMGDHVGEYCYNAYALKDKTCEGCPLYMVFKDGKIHTVQRSITDNKGTRYFEITASPLNDSTAKIIAGIEVVRNITERKWVEEALRESEEKYSNLFQHSNDAIFIHDLDGNIIDVNQKVLEQFGYTRAEILSLKIPALHPPEALETSRWAFEMIMQQGHISFDIDFKKKNGEIFTVGVSSSLFEVGGKRFIQGIARDITERKKIELELNERVKELEEFYEIAVERELMIKDLKKKIEELRSELSQYKKLL